jgi:dihydrofolate reductase
MSGLIFDLSVSLDGYVAGPNQTLDDPLGAGGEQLHEWAVGTRTFQVMHGREGGEEGRDSEIFDEWAERSGAVIMGRRMFSGGSGPWEGDPNANGWWGDEPPFRRPVFVLTHHAREPLTLGETTFTFVTDGIESALDQARAAAGDKDVVIGGGGQAVQQYLAAGLVHEFQIHLVPLFLGPGGVRLFDGIEPGRLECTRVVESPTGVTHLRYVSVPEPPRSP